MDFLLLLQDLRTDFFDTFFSLITRLGEEIFFIVLAVVLLWCVDKFEGYYMLSIGFVGTQLNQLLKVIFRVPRPWNVDPKLKPVEGTVKAATGYSFPSGHTQSAVGLLGSIARWNKGIWLRVGLVLIALLVAFSRLYLGVHTPLDVGVSIILGTVLVFGFYPIFKKVKDNPKIMYIFLGFMCLWSLAQVIFLASYNFPADANGEELYSSLKNSYKMLGAVLGLAVAYHIDLKYIRYETKAVWWAQILKVVLGLAFVVAVQELGYLVFGAILPEPMDRAFTYFAMVIFAGVIWPLTFKRFARPSKK